MRMGWSYIWQRAMVERVRTPQREPERDHEQAPGLERFSDQLARNGVSRRAERKKDGGDGHGCFSL